MPFVGLSSKNEAIGEALRKTRIKSCERVDDICAVAARLLAENHVVGWFQGRMELGARALGARSILANPADPAAIDLHICDLAVVDQLARHAEIMRCLAAGDADTAASRRQRGVCVIGAAEKGLLEPCRAGFFEHGDARRRRIDVLAKDLAGIDEQCPVAAKTLARRLKLVAVVGRCAAAERTPAALDGAKSAVACRAAAGQRLFRRVAKKLGCIGPFRIGAFVAEKSMDGRFALSPEQIP